MSEKLDIVHVVTPPRGTHAVFMDEDLMAQWATRSEGGTRIRWDWGEPDKLGFYTPAVTEDATDRLGKLDAAWAEAEAALPEGEIDLYLERHFNGYFANAIHDQVIGEGPTPADALRALAEKLRGGA